MHSSAAVLTERGGMTSHAAVIARGLGLPCVVGASDMRLEARDKKLTTADGRAKTALSRNPAAQWFAARAAGQTIAVGDAAPPAKPAAKQSEAKGDRHSADLSKRKPR